MPLQSKSTPFKGDRRLVPGPDRRRKRFPPESSLTPKRKTVDRRLTEVGRRKDVDYGILKEG